jgi:hypothetical protein
MKPSTTGFARLATRMPIDCAAPLYAQDAQADNRPCQVAGLIAFREVIMHTMRTGVLLLACIFACVALVAEAADRVRAGQWEQTLTIAGRTISKSTCLTQSDAEAINGDASSIKMYVEKVSAPAGCKVTDVKINGSQVVVTSVCASGKENVGTTTYHGDSFETVNTNGTRSEAKWIGACH